METLTTATGRPQARIHRAWPSWAVTVALASIFFGERVLAGSDRARVSLAVLASAALAAALGGRFRELSAATPEKRRVSKMLLGCTAGVAISLLLYALIPLALSSDGAKAARGIVWGLFPIMLACSAFPLAGIEIATLPSAYLERYELARVLRAFERGLALALLASSLFVANFLANRHEVKWDLSFGQKTSAAEPTRRAVRDLAEDVKVTLFFPRANEVAEAIEPYFDSLKVLSPHIQIKRIDHALAGQLAKDTGVTENGYVAVSHGKAHEKVRVGDKIATARSSIRKLDANFLGALLKVTREKKVAYFTTGHEERSASPATADNRPPIKLLKQLLETNQYTVKPLGIAEGLSTKLPEDASMIFIMGPEKPFSEGEIEVINKAAERHSRLFIALEAEREGEALPGILEPLGLRFDRTILANERTNVPFTRTDADRASIWSNRYSSHESVTTMTRNQKLATVFSRTGALTKSEDKVSERMKVDMVLTSVDDTFTDIDGDLTFDAENEKKSAFGLAAAITRTSTTGKKSEEGRIFVLADVDVLADELIKFEGNVRLLADIVYWLRNVEEPVVPAVSESDVQIVHKKEEDTLWFYGTTLGVPGLVLLLGFTGTRRRRHA